MLVNNNWPDLVVHLVMRLILFLFGLWVSIESCLGAESEVGQAMSLGKDVFKNLGLATCKSLMGGILWAVFGFLLGAVGGYFSWRAIRNPGWLDVSWGWYRYVRWMWPVLIVGTMSLGMSSMIGSWGAGRAVKQGMRQGEVIETAVFKTYAMVMVWRVDSQNGDANGSALLEQDLAKAVAQLRETDEQATELEQESRAKLKAEIEQKTGGSRLGKWLMGKLLDLLFDQVEEDLSGQDAVEFLSATLEGDQAGGEEQAIQFIRKKIMSAVYLAIDETVNSVVYPFMITVVLMMLAVLGVPLGSFWLSRWLWFKKYPEDSIDPQEPPVLNSGSESSE